MLLVYFSFTSLSTVGLGDLNPRSNFERIFIAIMLLLGVAIFSLIMGEFTNILFQYEAITSEIEDYNDLAKFLGIIKYLNKGR